MRYPCSLLGEPAGRWPFWRHAVHPQGRAAGRPRMRPPTELARRDNARRHRQQNAEQRQVDWPLAPPPRR